jgi:hypothetical protein
VVKRRVSVLLAAVMMLAATLAVSATAWAAPKKYDCVTPDGTRIENVSWGHVKHSEFPDGTVCILQPR